MVRNPWPVIVGAAALSASLVALAAPFLLAGRAAIEHPAAVENVPIAAPGAAYVITADLRLTNGATDTAQFQECFIAWVDGSATEVERVCEARKFASEAEAETALPDAVREFEAHRPENIASVDFKIERADQVQQ